MTSPTLALALLALAQTAPSQALSECKKPNGEAVEIPRGALSVPTYARLAEVVRDLGAKSQGYDPCHRPLAVIALEGTLASGDLGLAAFQVAVEQGILVKDEGFLAGLPEAQRTAIEAAWPKDGEVSDAFRYQMQAAFSTVLEAGGVSASRAWLAKAFAGQKLSSLPSLGDKLIGLAMDKPATEALTAPEGAEAITLSYGLRPRPGFSNLIKALESAGFDLVIVSSSPVWLAAQLAAKMGISETRIIGTRLAVKKDGTLAGTVLGPTPSGPGKVLALRTLIAPGGRIPEIVVGSKADDRPLLDQARRAAVLVQATDADLIAHAEAKRWLLEPANRER